MINDCVTDVIIANLALFPLPAPNSFATRTLQEHVIILKDCLSRELA